MLAELELEYAGKKAPPTAEELKAADAAKEGEEDKKAKKKKKKGKADKARSVRARIRSIQRCRAHCTVTHDACSF